MNTQRTQESRFPKKWIVIPAALLLLSVMPTLAFMGTSRGGLTGVVTFQGKPVTIGYVLAIAADGSMHSADIDPQGRYSLDKIPAGKVQVGVVSRDPAKALLRQQKIMQGNDRLPNEDRAAVRPAAAGKWMPLPVQYEDPRTSTLDSVIKGSTEFHIELR